MYRWGGFRPRGVAWRVTRFGVVRAAAIGTAVVAAVLLAAGGGFVALSIARGSQSTVSGVRGRPKHRFAFRTVSSASPAIPSPASSVGPAAVLAGRRATNLIDTIRGSLDRCGAGRHGYIQCGNRGVLHLPATARSMSWRAPEVMTAHGFYEVKVTSAAGVTFLLVRQGSGHLVRVCAPAGVGGCGAGGRW